MVNGAIPVGTASVNWGFDPLYTWRRTPPFSQMLDEMAQAGYAGTEISFHFPDDTAMLRTALEQHRLRAAGSFCALDLRDRSRHADGLQRARAMAQRLKALGSDVLILSDSPTPARLAAAGRVAADGSDSLSLDAFHVMADGLNRIGEAMNETQMRAVFHPHVGTYVETRGEIDLLCKMTDPALVGLCPDTGHLAYAGVAIEELFADYARRIGYVHLKDVDPVKLARVRAERVDFARAVEMGLFVELGTGAVPIPTIIDALRSARYANWLIVEQDAPPDPRAAAARNRAYLRETVGL